jgi:hypothetical protein
VPPLRLRPPIRSEAPGPGPGTKPGRPSARRPRPTRGIPPCPARRGRSRASSPRVRRRREALVCFCPRESIEIRVNDYAPGNESGQASENLSTGCGLDGKVDAISNRARGIAVVPDVYSRSIGGVTIFVEGNASLVIKRTHLRRSESCRMPHRSAQSGCNLLNQFLQGLDLWSVNRPAEVPPRQLE